MHTLWNLSRCRIKYSCIPTRVLFLSTTKKAHTEAHPHRNLRLQFAHNEEYIIGFFQRNKKSNDK